jgi:hypothetical protein
MPILSLEFDHAGRPTLELYVGVSAAEAEFRRPCPPVHVRALVDTGASTTNIVRSVFDRLGLSLVSQVPVHTASTGLTPDTVHTLGPADYRARGHGPRLGRTAQTELQ